PCIYRLALHDALPIWDHSPARSGEGRRPAGVRAAKRGLVTERVEGHGETTLVVEPSELVEEALRLRDEEGFNFLSDITAVDYLGWATRPVSGYLGTVGGRDINSPMTQGYQVVPAPKPKRFAMNYHLLAIGPDPRR